MDITDPKYNRFALVREMIETPDIVAAFDAAQADETAQAIRQAGRLFMTGEGSSRLFPAKNAMRLARQWGLDLNLATDGGRQALEYDLSDFAVFGASNSGQTKEVILLFQKLADAGHPLRFGLTANAGTRLESLSTKTYVLSCGKEEAVAATKSVVEQALFYHAMLAGLAGRDVGGALPDAATKVREALTLSIPEEMTAAIAQAGTIYFAGYNDGVAEELTLKTNEITRRKSDFLEGTYAVHGIEEVMDASDVVVIVDPIEAEEEKFEEVLIKGVGLQIFALASRPTRFPTVLLPDAGELSPYVQLAAGWNLLVEVGLALDIDLDKPERARKVGNIFEG